MAVWHPSLEDLVVRDTLVAAFGGTRVFVTGHTGFKGGWLCHWLSALGATVTGFSLDPPSVPSLAEAVAPPPGLVSVRGDIRDFPVLARTMADFAPQVVFHLAAQPLVRLSYAQPRDTFSTNVMGTVNVLEAVRQTPSVTTVINVTSDKCYENREWVWGYRENDPMGGRDPYSASKGCAELVAGAWLRSYFTPKGGVALASVRAGNVIGGGDWGADRLIPDCVRAFSQGDPVTLRYSQAIRPWQHVLEPLSGYLLLAARLLEDGPHYAGAWNFGPRDGEVWTVGQVVEHFAGLWGDDCQVRQETQPQPKEAHWLKLDCSKANSALGWRPRFRLAQALQCSADWYKAFYGGASATTLRQIVLQQIDTYLGMPPA